MLIGQYDVTAVIETHLVMSDSETAEVVVELGYRESDPYAVQAQFRQDGSATSTWLLARDLLAQGLVATETSPAGMGCVSSWRDEDPDYLLLVLSGDGGEALIAAPVEPIERFMRATRELVPFGAESDLIDSAVNAFVSSLLVV